MKTLSEAIAERVLQFDTGRNARNRATFILLRREVQEAIEQGYSLLTIWETLRDQGQVPFGYQAFRRYTKQLVKCTDLGSNEQ